MLWALSSLAILVQIYRIPKNETFYAAVISMYHATNDPRFLFALFNWMTPEQARDTLHKLPSIPMRCIPPLFDQLGVHPFPLERSEVIACLCEGEGKETNECLKVCVQNQYFLDDVSEEKGNEG